MRHSNVAALLLPIAAALLAGSCGMGSTPKAEFEKDSTDYRARFRDSTVYGMCGDGSTMNVVELITDADDTLMVSIAGARENERLFGGYEPGDRLALLLNKERSAATELINLSTILGDWVEVNPLDGTSERGFLLKDGGVVESINQASLTFRSWRIFNGKLILSAINEEGGNVEERYVYELQRLTRDTLVVTIDNQRYDYGRHKSQDYESLDIVIEDDPNSLRI